MSIICQSRLLTGHGSTQGNTFAKAQKPQTVIKQELEAYGLLQKCYPAGGHIEPCLISLRRQEQTGTVSHHTISHSRFCNTTESGQLAFTVCPSEGRE